MDPYVEACVRLEDAGVRYLLVGAFGANLYAREVGMVFHTADCDILIPPRPRILAKALRTLRSLGYELEAGDEPLVGEEDPVLLQGILRARAAIRALSHSARIDLMLELAGAGFERLWKRQRRVRIGAALLRLAPLDALIRSKQLANRPKDRLFLEANRAALEEMIRREALRSRSVRKRRT